MLRTSNTWVLDVDIVDQLYNGNNDCMLTRGGVNLLMATKHPTGGMLAAPECTEY